MGHRLEKAVLPNGKSVHCLRESEAREVYQQVQGYFRHGIRLGPGALVFDVGANIGLFTLLVHELCRHEVDVFAFEPIPAIQEALNANVRGLGSDRVRVLPCGLGAKAGFAVFAFYPRHSTLSTAFGSADDEEEIHKQLSESIDRNLEEAPTPLRWLRWLPRFLRSPIIAGLTRRSFQGVEELTCRIRTVSEVVREFGIDRLDLLKVDAEKSELGVLQGIEARDWPKIRQVVMEVHDLDGRLGTIVDLLSSNGVDNVITEQEPALRGSNVYSLYASRDPLEA
jgi:FkbM family methyltransferase